MSILYGIPYIISGPMQGFREGIYADMNINSQFSDEIHKLSGATNGILAMLDSSITRAKQVAEQQVAQTYGNGLTPLAYAQQYNQLVSSKGYAMYRIIDAAFETWATQTETDILQKPVDIAALINKRLSSKSSIKKLQTYLDNNLNKDLDEFINLIDSLSRNNPVKGKDYLVQMFNKQLSNTTEGGNSVVRINRTPQYLGDLGELVDAMTHELANKALQQAELGFSGPNFQAKIVGSENKKQDVVFGSIQSSTKNYQKIRQGFDLLKQKQNKAFDANLLALKKQSRVPVTIHQGGSLIDFLSKFSYEGRSISNEEELTGLIANTLYFHGYGEDVGYSDLMNSLNELIRGFGLVWLASAPQTGLYNLGQIDGEESAIPGFMTFTGAGIVPIYHILESIRHNIAAKVQQLDFDIHIEFSGITAGIRRVDSPLATHNWYNGATLGGKAYTHSANNPSATQYINLEERFQQFSQSVGTIIKMTVDIQKLFNIVSL